MFAESEQRPSAVNALPFAPKLALCDGTVATHSTSRSPWGWRFWSQVASLTKRELDHRHLVAECGHLPGISWNTLHRLAARARVLDESVVFARCGVHHLPTPLLLFVGHSTCGAIAAAARDYSAEADAIKRELNTIKITKGVTNMDGAITNLHQQVAEKHLARNLAAT